MSRTHPKSRVWLTVVRWVVFAGGFVGLVWATVTGSPYVTVIIAGFWALIGIGYLIRLIRHRGRVLRADPVITAAEDLQTLHTGTPPPDHDNSQSHPDREPRP